jgi:hypothetical protein
LTEAGNSTTSQVPQERYRHLATLPFRSQTGDATSGLQLRVYNFEEIFGPQRWFATYALRPYEPILAAKTKNDER